MESGIIKTFTDSDFGLEESKNNNLKKRSIVRGIIVDNALNVAVFNKRVEDDYKLPGGVVKENETTEETFLSEIKRIIGCEIEIIENMGVIKEIMGQDEIEQDTYVYVGRVIEKGKIDYKNQDLDEFGKVMWVSPEEALKLISDYKKQVNNGEIENLYHTKFSVYRDEYIIRQYLIKYVY